MSHPYDTYPCSECNKEYKYKKSLIKHIDSVHSKHHTETNNVDEDNKNVTNVNEDNKKMNEQINLELQKLTKRVEKLEASKEKRFCIACWEYESSFALSPCGHKMLCGTCAAQLIMQHAPVCPICRSRVNDIIQIWDTSIKESDTH